MPPAALVDPATIDTSHILYDEEAIRRGNPQRFEMEQLTAIVLLERDEHLIVGYKDVTDAEFWACVRDKQLPDRGPASIEPPAQALPAGLVHQLIHVAGVPEAEVATMTLDRALAVMNQHWSQPPKS